MATIGGDLLRILAHTVLQTGGNIGTQFLSSYLKPGMEIKEAAGKNLLDVINAGGPGAEEAAKSLTQDYGVAPWPRAPVVNPSGTEVRSPEGAKLTAPTSTPLAELAPGYTPEMGLVKGILPLDKLKSHVIAGMPQAQKEIAVAPKDTQMLTALTMKQMEIEARLGDKALDRETKIQLANQHAQITSALGLGMQQIHQGQLNATMDKNKWMATFLSQRALDQDEKTAHSLIGNAANQYQMIPMNKVEEKVTAANRFNALIDRYGEKYPEAVAGYTRVDPKTPEWGLGLFGGKPLPGVTPKGGPAKTPTGPTVPSPPTGWSVVPGQMSPDGFPMVTDGTTKKRWGPPQ